VRSLSPPEENISKGCLVNLTGILGAVLREAYDYRKFMRHVQESTSNLAYYRSNPVLTTMDRNEKSQRLLSCRRFSAMLGQLESMPPPAEAREERGRVSSPEV
jgi:hypothetical protein